MPSFVVARALEGARSTTPAPEVHSKPDGLLRGSCSLEHLFGTAVCPSFRVSPEVLLLRSSGSTASFVRSTLHMGEKVPKRRDALVEQLALHSVRDEALLRFPIVKVLLVELTLLQCGGPLRPL